MPATVIIGGQWGDEGKGRVVDFFARSCSVIARYSAGESGPHDRERSREVRLQPRAGRHLHAETTCVNRQGRGLNPQPLIEELDMPRQPGVETSRVRVSDPPRRRDAVAPSPSTSWTRTMRGEHAIGTTGTGTGPGLSPKDRPPRRAHEDLSATGVAGDAAVSFVPALHDSHHHRAVRGERWTRAESATSPRVRADGLRPSSRHRKRLLCRARTTVASRSCSKERRGPCSTSITARTPT